MNAISLDKSGIHEYQQNRAPYLMIDYATEVIPGVSAKGYKDLKDDEWFFKVHWKNDQTCLECYKLSLSFKCPHCQF